MGAIALSSNLFAQMPRRKAFELISGLGFRSVDIWASPSMFEHVDPRVDRPEDVRADLEEFGLEPLALSAYHTYYEEKVERLRLAASLKIPYVVFEPSPAANFVEMMSNLDVEGRTLTPPGASWQEFTKTLVHFLDLAEDLGVRVGLEVPHVYSLVETTADLQRLIDEVRHPALYFTVAPTHTAARGNNLQEIIRACGDRLGILYLWNVKPDFRAEVDDRAFGVPAETLALEGFFDFVPLIRSAEKSGRPSLCVTCHGTESWTDPSEIVRVVREATAKLALSPR